MRTLGLVILAGCTLMVQPAAAPAATETVLHSFAGGSDGATPLAGLLKQEGLLYGTTEYGGAGKCAKGCGTVFSLDPGTGAESVVHAFSGADGRQPTARLIVVKGELYGTTVSGGTNDEGTVFSLDPETGTETVVHSFDNDGTDGLNPYDGLCNVDGTLYGTTKLGGSGHQGAVFSIAPGTGSESVLHGFGGDPDGQYPYTGLIDVGGKLYGTTGQGGTRGWGTVFALNRKSGKAVILHSFGAGTDGQHAYSEVTAVDGVLYGTTDYGGTYGYGTVYSISLATGAESVIHSFAGSSGDGNQPVAALVNVKGVLYGTSKFGGAYGAGTVFAVDIGTDTLSLVYSFGASGTDGAHPYAGLVEKDGTLYGTTSDGGAANLGTAFTIVP